MTTVWTKGPGRVPLYSDWKVCFTTTTTTKTATTSSGSSSSSSRTSAIRSGKDYQDTDSVSTSTTSPSSTGEEDSAVHSDSIHENENENESESEQHEEVQEEGQEVVHTDSIHNENENDAKLEDEVSEEEQQEGETKVAYFYVHRNMIGPKSEFFTKSFLSRTNGSGNNNNNNNNTTSESVVSLPADLPTHYFNSVVEAFEILLEYCYQIQRPSNSNSIGGGSSSGRLFDLSERLTTSNVVALFCLCQSFGMDSGITEQVRSVLDTDLTPDTVAQYYQIVKDLRSNAEEQHQHQHQQQQQQQQVSESESVSMQPPPPPPLKEKTVGGDPSSSGSSITLDAGPIMDRIIALCRKHPSVLRPDSDLPKIADLPLWLALGKLLTLNNNNNNNNNSNDEDSGDNLEATRNNNNNNNNEEEKEAEAEAEAEENNSKIWSENIAHFFDTCEQRGVLMQEYFREPFRVLTAECVLPEVSETVALRLLEYEHKQGLDDIIVVVGDDDDDDDDDPTVSSDNEDSQNQNNNNNNNRYESDLEPREDDNGDEDDNEEQKEEDLTPAATATATAAAQKMDRSHSNNNNNAGRLTNLQQRCIKALGESNWAGPENELEGRTGTLTEITTPVVLEQLLIRSATRERALVTRCKDLEATLRAERELQAEKDEKLEFFNKEKDFAIAREVGKQLSLQNSLEKEKEKRKTAEEKLEKLVTATKVLCKANASLQAELEAAQTESNNLSRRVRTLEITRRKTESDREMFELSVKETIKRLENIVHSDDWGTSCGGLLGALTMMMSSESDHVECARIKSMLQQVVQDPMAYERNFLNQGCGDADTYTMAASKSNDDTTFNTTSNIGDFDDCSIATEPKA